LQARGVAWFDLGGLNTDTMRGVAQFKLGAGGECFTLAGTFL
jgi:lipid II:glycine glycyltransferase (peptidoglycan interpeptide bridge formation enzyme)